MFAGSGSLKQYTKPGRSKLVSALVRAARGAGQASKDAVVGLDNPAFAVRLTGSVPGDAGGPFQDAYYPE